MTVNVTTFEIIGEGRKLADAFEAEKKAANVAQWEFVKEVGGSCYFANFNGGLRAVLFDGELPAGWRRIGSAEGLTEAVPRRGSRVGKGLIARIADLPEIPDAFRLARQLGFEQNFMPMGGGKIYFPTELRVEFPRARHFLRLPLTAGEDFTRDESRLIEIRESEFVRAVEDHNAEAKRLREEKVA